MAGEIYHLPISRRAKPLPSGEVRIGEWREYDDLGVSLPQRSVAAEWSAGRIAITVGSLLITVALAVALWMFAGCLIFFFIGGLAGPANRLRRWYKGRLLRKVGVEETPTDAVICVSYEVDGFEYGRDLGKLVYEGDWLFFEGERSSFSLAKEDVASWRINPSSGQGDGVVLALAHTDGHVSVRLEAISDSGYSLWSRYLAWHSSAGQSAGIAVLPPMEPSRRNDFRKIVKLGDTLGAGFTGLIAGLVFAGLSGGSVFSGYGLIVWAAIAATVGLVGHRISMHEKRKAAFASLPRLRRAIKRWTPPKEPA